MGHSYLAAAATTAAKTASRDDDYLLSDTSVDAAKRHCTRHNSKDKSKGVAVVGRDSWKIESLVLVSILHGYDSCSVWCDREMRPSGFCHFSGFYDFTLLFGSLVSVYHVYDVNK